jgi:anti-sigma regulatory factor (Ser/Thr protein kinase)
MTIPPRATLLLYSDGLVERRRTPLEHGITRVSGLIQDGRASTLDDLANRIMSDLAPRGGYQDDVVLLLYRHPAPLELDFPAEARHLAGIRAALRNWLSRVRVEQTQAQDVLVAVGEAVANAVEHGHRHTSDGMISLRATALVDEIQMTVTDTGSWKPPAANPHRGRGIAMMRALMHDVAIHQETAGTTVHLSARIT